MGQLGNPDSTIALGELACTNLLREFAASIEGLSTGDGAQFLAAFWEVEWREGTWEPFIQSVDSTQPHGGRSEVLRWESGAGSLHSSPSAHNFPSEYMNGRKVLGKPGLRITQMQKLSCTFYGGEIFGKNGATVIPHDPSNLPALWCFATSPEYGDLVREIDQSLKVTVGSLLKVPFDLSRWQRVASKRYPNGLPKPYSDDPTQWLFHGHPQPATEPLQVAVARLTGYRWPTESDSSMELSDEARDWVSRCEALTSHADDDGIVCLPSVRGEPAAHERLSKLLASAFGDDWASAKERELLMAAAAANNARMPETSLKSWLRNSFFSEHCKLFQSRPFVWQVWDGNPSGFSALVNVHKLAAPTGQGRKTLEQLTFTYLGDWIDRQKLDQAQGVNGADDRLAAALDLQGQLKKILDGEPPYDIFVRWKPLHEQPIGWDSDINDGVRLNIRPFLNAQLRKGGKAGAGILRAKPGTIKWAKDRGKEPMRSKDDFPWFWGWDESDRALDKDFGAPIPVAPPAGDSFDGNRWNDLHYTRAAKEAARARYRGEG